MREYVPIVIIVAFVMLWQIDNVLGPSAPPPASAQLLGTWERVGPDGAVDARLKLSFDEVHLPSSGCMGASIAYDGVYEQEGLLDGAGARGGWNYASWDPLVLNLVWDVQDGLREAGSLTIRLGDDTAITARGTLDPAQALQPGFLDSAHAVVLQRVAPPEGPVPD